MFLMTCGVLAFGVVGAACGGEDERVWWLGFAVFGWGYLIMASWSEYYLPRPPTITLLDALRSYIVTLVPKKAGYCWRIPAGG
jgi:hypothetical protein